MEKWHPVQSKFSAEQWKHIQEFMDKHGVKTPSKLIKLAVEEFIGLTIADSNKKENKELPIEYLASYHLYEYLKRELKSHPRIQKKFEKSFSKWKSGFFRIWTAKHNEKLYQAGLMWDPFREIKVGRPKAPKKQRGRQKDTGI